MPTASSVYPALAKKYSLPSLKDIEYEFDLPEFAKSPFPLADLVKKILERIDALSQILEPMIQTESFTGMLEIDAIPESRKKEIMTVIKELMFQYRQGQIELLVKDEASNAAYIKQFWKAWPSQRLRIKGFLETVRDSWKSVQFPVKHEQKGGGYFG